MTAMYATVCIAEPQRIIALHGNPAAARRDARTGLFLRPARVEMTNISDADAIDIAHEIGATDADMEIAGWIAYEQADPPTQEHYRLEAAWFSDADNHAEAWEAYAQDNPEQVARIALERHWYVWAKVDPDLVQEPGGIHDALLRLI